MNDPPVPTETPPNSSSIDELTELRNLLFGQEQAQIISLQEELKKHQVDAGTVGKVLPDAITTRSQQDRALTQSLQPTVEEALQASIKKNPRVLVDIIFPVLGPAIRKAISIALTGMIQSLNQVLEQSFSIQGLKWRLEAVRTGRSFAEIVLLHTLLYRVEQIFLIHRETGLMLQSVTAPSVVAQDAQMVSGMLTAIQDFVHDSFAVEQTERLETLRVGELNVWIEQGSYAVLAGVIRGNAPNELRATFQDALEQIHFEKGQDLSDFQGDAEPFEEIRPHLENCLAAQYSYQKEQSGRLSPIWILLLILLIPLGIWIFFAARDNLRWQNYVTRLSNEHGIVITTAEKRSGKYFLAGLRDPLSKDPEIIRAETALTADKVESHWEPYQALYPEFILTRAKSILLPPATVTLSFNNGVLTAKGSAAREWITDARKLARAIAGVTNWQDNELSDSSINALQAVKASLEKALLLFVSGSTELAEGQQPVFEQLVDEIKRLDALAQSSNRHVKIEIFGRTDKEGNDSLNNRLSQARADWFAGQLSDEMLKVTDLRAVGVSTTRPIREEVAEQDRKLNRSLSFQITIGE